MTELTTAHPRGVRLPLAISALIAVTLLAFVAVSYEQVRQALLLAGDARARSASEQIAGLLAQAAQQRLTEVRRVAHDPAVVDYLRRPDADASVADAARRRLATLTTANQPPVELWDAHGRRLLTSAAGAHLDAPPPDAMPAAGVSPFALDGALPAWTVAAPVDQGDRGSGGPAGRIVARRTLSGASNSAILKLIGEGARIRLGNQSGGLWTDLSKAVPAPAADVRPGATVDERDPDGERYLGAAVAVQGTPWIVLVEFPRAPILSSARAFLWKMLLAAATLAGLAGFAAYRISTRITDLNSRLEQQNAQLTQLTSELESFSYSVSHDLRAPLRHIAGFCALLEKSASGSLDDRGRRYLQTISTAATRMGRLIDDLLVFSRMGRGEMLRTRVDLAALIGDARREVTPDADGRSIEWDVRPLPMVEGDPMMLRQVFVNLLSNAVKYTTPRESARIEIGTVPAQNETVVFVRDNGVGFDMQYAGKLFGVFQRLHSADEFEGTGIGLASVRRIVQRHGGRTWAEAAPDAGATFFVSLPKAN